MVRPGAGGTSGKTKAPENSCSQPRPGRGFAGAVQREADQPEACRFRRDAEAERDRRAGLPGHQLQRQQRRPRDQRGGEGDGEGGGRVRAEMPRPDLLPMRQQAQVQRHGSGRDRAQAERDVEIARRCAG